MPSHIDWNTELPDSADVTLSQALSWLAWGRAMDGELLCNAMEMFSTPRQAGQFLNDTLNKFSEAFKSGKVTCTARYAKSREDRYGAITTALPSFALHDFRRIDPCYDALLFGDVVTFDGEWLDYFVHAGSPHPESGRTDGYYGVKVKRDDVQALRSSLAVWTGANTLIPHSDIVIWCRKWIANGNGVGGDKAWDHFKTIPKYAGLSRDDAFRPAWREAKTK